MRLLANEERRKGRKEGRERGRERGGRKLECLKKRKKKREIAQVRIK